MNKLILPLLLLISFSAYADMSTNNGRIQPSQSNSSGFKSDGRTYTSNSKQSAYLKSSTTGARSNRPVNVTVQNQVSKRTVMSNVFQNAKKGLNFKNVGSGLLRRTPNLIAYGLVAYDICLKSKKCKSMVIDEVEDFFDTENTEGLVLIYMTNDGVGALGVGTTYTYKRFQNWCASESATLPFGETARICQIKSVLPDDSTNIGTVLENACIGAAQVDIRAATSLPVNMQPTNSRGQSGFCAYSSGNRTVLSKISSQFVRIKDYVPLTESRFIEIAKDEADEDPDGFIRASKDEDGKVPGMSKPIVIDIDVEVVISNPYTDPNDGKPKQTKWEFEKDEKGEVRVKETHEDRPDLEPNSPQAPKVKLDIDLEDDDKKEEQDKKQDNDEDDKPTEIEVELCEDGSDIIACQKLGEVDKDQFDALEVPKEEDNTAWSKEDLLPPTGVCPAPRSVNLHGYTISMEYTAICGVAERIRAVVLAVSMIAAGLMVVGSLRR